MPNGPWTHALAREMGLDPSAPLLVTEPQAYLCLAWPDGAVTWNDHEWVASVEAPEENR